MARMRIAKRAKRATLILRPNVIRLLMFFWTLEVVRRREGNYFCAFSGKEKHDEDIWNCRCLRLGLYRWMRYSCYRRR